MPELELPPEVEEYRLIRLLGSGAMGRVYLAEDRLLDRLVAIKFIAAASPSPSARQRFFTEARAAARITHSNVVAVYRVAEFRRQPFLVAEYVRGQSLAEATRPMGSTQLIKIASDLARGLAAAHRRGVLHRDIKPANAMMSEEGVTKLLDFGLAELVNDAGVAEKTRLAGTPIYMAPELWTGADPSPRSDIFALGILLFELYCGAHPFDRKDGNKAEDRGEPLECLADDADPALCAVIERCISPDPLLRYGSADALVEALDGLTTETRRAAIAIEGSPYRGLLAFEAEHRDLFFGRRSEALAIRERLRGERMVVVAGDSGTGKSSLCRAGVLPLVEDELRVVNVALGRAPMLALAVALSARVAESDAVTVDRLTQAPAEVARSLRAGDREVLVFIDQLEELVTQVSRAEAELVSETLQVLVVSHGIRLLATARSDFLTRLAALRGFGDDLATSLSLLRPLSEERLFEVVVEPAATRGVSFESEHMVAQLIAEAHVAEGGLPLLQFALGELWEARDRARQLIPEAALVAIGGVAGALARHADGVIAALPASDRRAARALFLSLVTEDGTRSHREHDDLLGIVARHTTRGQGVLAALVNGRLLVAQESESGGQTAYAIAHEALLARWDTLQGWLNEDTEGRAAKQRIERAAAEWDRLGRRSDSLWNARQLGEAAAADHLGLGPRELAFLEAARTSTRRRAIRRWTVIVGVPMLVVAGLLASHFQTRAKRQATISTARRLVTRARIERARDENLRGAAFAKFDTGDAGAERSWSLYLDAVPELDKTYAQAETLLSRLLQDDQTLEDARELLVEILFERATLADQNQHAEQRDDLVRALSLYDAGDRWTQPGTVAISVEPPSASLELSRFQGNQWIPAILTSALPPGSYRVTASTSGYEAVAVPFVLHRGEHAQLAIKLPRPPPFSLDMVFVPGGTFLYGGAEASRAIFDAEPIHPVVTADYWIARNETTYREWLAYLRDLPEPERAEHLPHGNRQTFMVQLEALRDGFRLHIGPENKPLVLNEDQPLEYTGRNTSLDWSKLPVSGISFRDVLAYTRWLQSTGRVPGARPCTEWEWEHASRGADGRLFTTGEVLTIRDANFDQTHGRLAGAFGPDEVGTFSARATPYGVNDLAGNVWEWTTSHSDWHSPVGRGGSFYQEAIVARAENRAVVVPELRDAHYGIRVCSSFKP